MSVIRSFLLEAITLIGAVVGIAVAIGSYLANLPIPPERVAIATGWMDPATTGSIIPRAGCATRKVSN